MIPRIAAKLKKRKKEYIYRITTIHSVWSIAKFSLFLWCGPLYLLCIAQSTVSKKRRIYCKEMMGHAWNSHTHEKKERKGANAEKLYRKVYVLLIPSYIIQHIDVHRLFGNEWNNCLTLTLASLLCLQRCQKALSHGTPSVLHSAYLWQHTANHMLVFLGERKLK